MIFTSILTLITAQALPSLNSRKLPSIYITRITALIFIYSGLLSLNSLNIETISASGGIGIYNGFFQITEISILFESFLFFIGAFILVGWPFLNKQASPASPVQVISPKFEFNKSADYSLIVLFSTLGSSLLISSFDLISLYISIELQSFGLYVLATLYRNSENATKAGLKYFLLGGLSSCIILLGCGLVYSYTGLTNFESINSLISTVNSYSVSDIGSANSISLLAKPATPVNLGLILIFIGFLFKIAAAPLHNWSPDVYDEVPTIVTTWLTIIPKIAILILLLELQFYYNSFIFNNSVDLITNWTSLGSSDINSLSLFNTNLSFGFIIKHLLLVSSFLSLLIGTIVGLAQTRIKRLLAYSTISHIGFILLALAIYTESSIDSLFFYIIQYTITNLNIFLILLALSYLASPANSVSSNVFTQINFIKDIRYIKELRGEFVTNPLLTISLAICLFSMAGIPPLIGFFSKQFVLYSAIQNGYYFISLIAIVVSVISASYYIKIVKVLFSEGSEDVNSTININAELNYLNDGNFNKDIYNNLNANNDYLISKSSAFSSLHSYLISILSLSILLFIFKPSLILNSTQLLSLSIFYN